MIGFLINEALNSKLHLHEKKKTHVIRNTRILIFSLKSRKIKTVLRTDLLFQQVGLSYIYIYAIFFKFTLKWKKYKIYDRKKGSLA